MNDLRLILLVLGACVIAGIYIWGTLQNRRQQRHQMIQDRSSVDTFADVKITSRPDTDIDYSSALEGLNQSISAFREETVNAMPADNITQQNDLLHNGGLAKKETMESQKAGASVQNSETSVDSGHTQTEASVSHQRITTLHIIPRAKKLLDGKAILCAMDELDMTIGEMQIFHHYGVGDMKMEKALFSLANMIEPGNFHLETMDEFATPGLVMFMCMPSVVDAQVVFELMLNTAQRMAEMLGADVCDENRNLINEQKLESIRSTITV